MTAANVRKVILAREHRYKPTKAKYIKPKIGSNQSQFHYEKFEQEESGIGKGTKRRREEGIFNQSRWYTGYFLLLLLFMTEYMMEYDRNIPDSISVCTTKTRHQYTRFFGF